MIGEDEVKNISVYVLWFVCLILSSFAWGQEYDLPVKCSLDYSEYCEKDKVYTMSYRKNIFWNKVVHGRIIHVSDDGQLLVNNGYGRDNIRWWHPQWVAVSKGCSLVDQRFCVGEKVSHGFSQSSGEIIGIFLDGKVLVQPLPRGIINRRKGRTFDVDDLVISPVQCYFNLFGECSFKRIGKYLF